MQTHELAVCNLGRRPIVLQGDALFKHDFQVNSRVIVRLSLHLSSGLVSDGVQNQLLADFIKGGLVRQDVGYFNFLVGPNAK